MFPVLIIFVQAAWLWVCFVTFTKDYTQSWLKMILVVFAATIPGVLIGIASLGVEGSQFGLYVYITANILRYVIIYLAMVYLFHVTENKTILKIIAMNFVGRAIVHLIT